MVLRYAFLLTFLVFNLLDLHSQNPSLYFPPKAVTAWQTTAPAQLGFCPERIDSLYHFLETHHSKGFLLLKDGRIVLEKYFGSFVQDSIWYWASAGKSLTAFLVGQAQEEGLLDIDDPTSDYLGTGWTSAPPDKEALIQVVHQLSMTTGLDDTFTPTPTEPDPNTCTDPDCLNYLADAGTRWGYHTGPYRLLHPVLEAASGLTINQFTKTHTLDRTGMKGLWVSDVFYSTARAAARFGLLALAGGIWDGDTLLHDAAFFHDMTHSSQTLNRSYGYLWWLNGQQSFMVPGLQIVFPGKLIPNAPDDLIAALGKNDQKIHVVPSKGWVVVRMGEAGGFTGIGGDAVPIAFDNAMWAYLNALVCTPLATAEVEESDGLIWPNPGADGWWVDARAPIRSAQVFDLNGREIQAFQGDDSTRLWLPADHLPEGIYLLQLEVGEKSVWRRLILAR